MLHDLEGSGEKIEPVLLCQRFQFGYASAVAVIMLAISLLIALSYQRFVLRRDIQGALTTMSQ